MASTGPSAIGATLGHRQEGPEETCATSHWSPALGQEHEGL